MRRFSGSYHCARVATRSFVETKQTDERERERERNCRHTRDWWKARGVASSLRERGVGTFKWRSSVTHAHGTQRPLTKTEAVLTVLICETSGMEAVEPPPYEKA